MKVNNTQVVEFVQFCKFILAYSGLLTALNVLLLNKDYNLLLVLTTTLPALVSYFGFKYIGNREQR